MSDIAERVKKIIVVHLGVDKAKVTESAIFIEDLGANSLETVELVMAFEEEFSCEIPEGAVEQIVTVQDAITFIETHSHNQARPQARAGPCRHRGPRGRRGR